MASTDLPPSPYVAPVYEWDGQHDGTEHLAINNTFFRRCLIRLALRTTAKFYKRNGPCISISKNKIVKTGYYAHLTEGATIQYLAENTNIPVPKVYCSFLHKKRAYIVMERIQGKTLPTSWKSLSKESLESILAQLRAFIQELRSLAPPPGTGVESCVGGTLLDSRLTRGRPRFGPFKTIQGFHYWLRRDLKPQDLEHREKDQEWEDLIEMMRLQDGPCNPPVFTHGDLHPFNIIVHDGKVAGIVDWEFAGWYPHYWEYMANWHSGILRTEWRDMLDKFLDRPRPEEFKMDTVRNQWWGE
ncbi:kinase-like domain-containing protein [Xylaria palmicola]|nr:kinase-like domain-containing protein [Xylaria palmicola]